MFLRRLFLSLIILVLSTAAPSAQAGAFDPSGFGQSTWDGHFGVPGVNGSPRVMQVVRGRLFLGGGIDAAENQRAQGLILWDGRHWQPVRNWAGGGIVAMANDRNELIVATKTGIYRQTPRAFVTLYHDDDARILGLCVYRGQLYALFPDTSGDLHRLTPDGWRSVPGSASAVGGGIFTHMIPYRNQLILTTPIYIPELWENRLRIVSWNGRTWKTPEGQDPLRVTQGPVVYHRDLLFLTANGLLSWHGSEWTQVPGMIYRPELLCVRRNRLFAVALQGPYPPETLYEHVGDVWRKLGEFHPGPNPSTSVQLLGSSAEQLVIGGSFVGLCGVISSGVVFHDGEEARPAYTDSGTLNGIIGTPTSLYSYRGDLIVSGRIATFGTTGIKNTARWDGKAWHSMGSKTDAPVLRGMATVGDRLLGFGPSNPNRDALSMMEWNGDTWRFADLPPIPDRPSPNPIYDMVAIHDGFAVSFAGSNTLPFRVYVYEQGRWNNTFITSPLFPPRLATFHDELLIFGDPFFCYAWRGPFQFRRPFSGLGGKVEATVEYQGRLLLSGHFAYTSPTGPPFPWACIVWNGTEWWPLLLPDGLEAPQHLLVHEDVLYAMGKAGDDSGQGSQLWAYRDSTWTLLDEFAQIPEFALAWKNRLVAAGKFSRFASVVSSGIAMRPFPSPTGAVAAPSPRREELGITRPEPQLTISPNPANPSTTLRFQLPHDAPVRIGIYDLAGRVVWKRDLGIVSAGNHSLTWRGADKQGATVSSGVYFVRLRMGERVLRKKLIIAR